MRAQIGMDDAPFVRVSETARDAFDDRPRRLVAHPFVAHFAHEAAQPAAAQGLHRDEHSIVVLIDVVHAHDVRMLEMLRLTHGRCEPQLLRIERS